jgi:hypothetical protein
MKPKMYCRNTDMCNLPFTIKITIGINLCEFEAVAKALRRVAEGKAAAQAEAAEWKRKYELETAHKHRSKIKGKICICY